MRLPAFVVAAALLLTSVPQAQQTFWTSETMYVDLPAPGCQLTDIRFPELSRPWLVRVSVTSRPGPRLNMSFSDDEGLFSRVNGSRGYLEVVTTLRAGPARDRWVCVEWQPRDVGGTYEVAADWIGRPPPRVPHAGDHRAYDDELYRHLIYDQYDGPATSTSWVLRNPTPQFYIRRGGPHGCSGGTHRLDADTLHYWRAIVPIVAEQLTGVPYPHRVETGCDTRSDTRDWVMVTYVTLAEYLAESGEEWGDAVARASTGNEWGRIWMGFDGQRHRLTDYAKDVIAHQIGHAFGLSHTNRSGTVMQSGTLSGQAGEFHIFSPDEEYAARAAYRAGRGAPYRGNPRYQTQTAEPTGMELALDDLVPRIVVD